MTNSNGLQSELKDHILVIQQTVDQCAPVIEDIVNSLIGSFKAGHKLILCGNGGSAADAQHIAAEFVNRFRFDRPALPAMALTTDSSILTAIGNDSSFDFAFSRQFEALARKGDVLAVISTSGSSVNIHNVLSAARSMGVMTIGFTGENGRDLMGEKCDICLVVPSIVTARIQESHEFVWHFICGAVESGIFRT